MAMIELPQWAEEYVAPMRYKVAYGGRSAAKSYSYASLLLLSAAQQHERVLCCREIQRSIANSVKRILDDQIRRFERIGAFPRNYFVSTRNEISCPTTDSLFIFSGLKSNVDSIRSSEGITKVWVDEAQNASQNSLTVLIPTIRAPGSELWFSFNPRYEDDPVYQLFVVGPAPPNALIKKVNYYDNKWFSDENKTDMLWDKERDPDKYRHVWLGEPVRHSKAQVMYGVWREDEVPEPPKDTIFYYGLDFGFSGDPTALVRCWIDDRTLYIDRELYNYGVELDDLPTLIKSVVPDGWQIYADPSRPDAISHLNRHGLKVTKARAGKNSIVEGIGHLRSFDIVIDPSCKNTVYEFMSYSYKTDPVTDEVTPIIIDAHNHIVDCCRYALSYRRSSVKKSKAVLYSPLSIENPRRLFV